VKDLMYTILFKSFKYFIILIPNSFVLLGMKGFTRVLYFFDKKHRKVAQVNLDLAYEDNLSQIEKEHIIKSCYLNLGMSLVDFIENQGISKEALLSKVTFKNEKILENVLAQKKKVILVTAHYGNWELVALSIAAKFGDMTIIGRDLDSFKMNSILKQNREQFGIEVIDKKGAMKSMISALKANRMLGLLVDQNTSDSEGLLVNFFEKPVRHTPSAAILSRRFDAVILPVYITTEDYKHYTLTFYDSIETAKTNNKGADILDCVQKQAKITEEVIRRKPEEWFWLHKRWKNQFEHCYD